MPDAELDLGAALQPPQVDVEDAEFPAAVDISLRIGLGFAVDQDLEAPFVRGFTDLDPSGVAGILAD